MGVGGALSGRFWGVRWALRGPLSARRGRNVGRYLLKSLDFWWDIRTGAAFVRLSEGSPRRGGAAEHDTPPLARLRGMGGLQCQRARPTHILHYAKINIKRYRLLTFADAPPRAWR